MAGATAPLILVLDAGTTSTRALLFGLDGQIHACAQQSIQSDHPQPGWVEQDATAIWSSTLASAREVMNSSGAAGRIAAIGITNQRETVVAWDCQTGEPLAPAIIWQDRRTGSLCNEFKQRGLENAVTEATGLLLDPYFSATKIRWLLDHAEAVKEAGNRLMVGTVDSWLLFKLADGVHLTDASNASRTLLMRLDNGQWDEALCGLFGVPLNCLPTIGDSAGSLAAASADLLGRSVPVCAMIGDQQSATIGQGCLSLGQTKVTFGTGAFALTNAGPHPPISGNRLLSTLLIQINGNRTYALEGSLFVAGSMVQWLRDQLGIIGTAAETEALARSVPDSGGVSIIPAFCGLGAPHWRADITASIHGLTLGTGRGEIVRAALEALVNQIVDLADAFAADGVAWTGLRADGGMIANDWLAQDLADMLGLGVERPLNVESTARGAAMLAAVGAGFFPSLEEACHAMLPPVTRFDPRLQADARERRLDRWHRELASVLARP
ncbi:MAG TPA: glycerol kinase GlpK [Sphingomicrobium sp.]|nr:glycerol kinase GlpK [Sphingomicrobium sp.]